MRQAFGRRFVVYIAQENPQEEREANWGLDTNGGSSVQKDGPGLVGAKMDLRLPAAVRWIDRTNGARAGEAGS